MGAFEGVIACVVLVVVLAFGFGIGSDSQGDAWKKDCEALGLHRVGTVVYFCKKQ